MARTIWFPSKGLSSIIYDDRDNKEIYKTDNIEDKHHTAK